jgi:hypothetical protein
MIAMADPIDAANPAPAYPLRVRYELAREDARAAYWYNTWGNPRARRNLMWGLPLLAIGGVRLGYVAGGAPLAILLAVMLPLVLFVQIPWMATRTCLKQPAFRGPHEVWLTPEAVRGNTEGVGDSSLVWAYVSEITGTGRHLLIRWKSGSVTMIPRTAFHAPADAELFLTEARRYWAAATAQPVFPTA